MELKMKKEKMIEGYYTQWEEDEGKYTFIIAERGAAKTKAMQEYYNKFIKEKEK